MLAAYFVAKTSPGFYFDNGYLGLVEKRKTSSFFYISLV